MAHCMRNILLGALGCGGRLLRSLIAELECEPDDEEHNLDTRVQAIRAEMLANWEAGGRRQRGRRRAAVFREL